MSQSQQSRSDKVDLLYKSLPLTKTSGSIRVLKVPAAPSDDRTLRADFSILDLNTEISPEFDALSYVWGEIEKAAPTSLIKIGREQVPIQLTDNCYNALIALRPSEGSLIIWVDAICINQNDDAEKVHQLSLMGDIFSTADTTYIWLGKQDFSKVLAMECLEHLGLLGQFFSTSQQFPGASVNPRPWLAVLVLYWRQWRKFIFENIFGDLIDEFSASAACEGFVTVRELNSLLNNSWLYRVWTYQEVMLSHNPILVCGEMRIHWWRFAMSLLYLHSTQCDNDRWYNKSHFLVDEGRNLDKLMLPLAKNTRELFVALRHWRGLIMDRNELQMSRRSRRMASRDTILDMNRYSKFLSDIAWIFMLETSPTFFPPLLVPKIFFAFGGLGAGIARASTTEGRWPWVCFHLGWGLLLFVFCVWLLLLHFILDNRVRRPCGRPGLRYKPEMWPSEALVQNTILSALWTRNCKFPRDFNFGTRNLVQALTETKLPHLEYTSSLAEVYRDLTVHVLRLSESPELILGALRSQVQGAPSWTVDWARRDNLRIHLGRYEREHLSFYDATKSRMPPDSWRYCDSRPGVLQVRAWTLGIVIHVLDFKELEQKDNISQYEQHIHNLTALLRMADAAICAEDWSYIRHNHLEHLGGAAASLFWTHHKSSPEEILRLLKSDGVYQGRSSMFGSRCSDSYPKMFSKYLDFCNYMAKAQDRRIVVLAGARRPNSSGNWPSNLGMGKCHPVTTGDGNVKNTQYEECRIKPGDGVLQLCGLREKAVVRQVEGKLVFVEALEAMGSHVLVTNCMNHLVPDEMPFVDIS